MKQNEYYYLRKEIGQNCKLQANHVALTDVGIATVFRIINDRLTGKLDQPREEAGFLAGYNAIDHYWNADDPLV